MDWITPSIGLVGALLGAGIAGYFSLKATYVLIFDQRKLLKEEHVQKLKEAEAEKKARIKAVVCALYHEIKSVWTLYMDGVGKLMDAYVPDSNGFRYTFPIIGNYFPVFDSSVSTIGIIPDAKLRHQIISTYALGKSLMDTFKYNNELILRWEKASDEVFLNNANAPHMVLKVKVQNLAQYAGPLKDLHNKCKASVEELIKNLEEDATSA